MADVKAVLLQFRLDPGTDYPREMPKGSPRNWSDTTIQCPGPFPCMCIPVPIRADLPGRPDPLDKLPHVLVDSMTVKGDPGPAAGGVGRSNIDGVFNGWTEVALRFRCLRPRRINRRLCRGAKAMGTWRGSRRGSGCRPAPQNNGARTFGCRTSSSSCARSNTSRGSSAGRTSSLRECTPLEATCMPAWRGGAATDGPWTRRPCPTRTQQ
jgi:hypothetical protein